MKEPETPPVEPGPSQRRIFPAPSLFCAWLNGVGALVHAGAPPPEAKLAVPDDYGAESEGIASSSWWDMMSLTIFGKKVSNEQAS